MPHLDGVVVIAHECGGFGVNYVVYEVRERLRLFGVGQRLEDGGKGVGQLG